MKMLLIPAALVVALTACSAEEPAVATGAPIALPAVTDPASATGALQAPATTAAASGTVESVDAASGKIIIAHGPVAALNWPAMTMGFQATPEQVKAVQPGQKVDFEFTNQGAVSSLTSIRPVP